MNPRSLAVPAPVIAEACHLVEKRCGSRVEATFLEDLGHGWYGTVTAVMPEELLRAAELVRRYESLPLGGTDRARHRRCGAAEDDAGLHR